MALKRTTKAGEYVSWEYEVLEMIKDCDNCVKVLDIFYTKNKEGKMAQNLVFEYCKENIENMIQQKKESKGHFTMDEIWNMMQ